MEEKPIAKKRMSSVSTGNSGFAFFDELPDDLATAVISKVGATAACPADFFNLLFVCKRLNALGFSPMVLSKLPPSIFTCKAGKWCDEAHNFLKSCADADNLEAIYYLAMIQFYCLGMRESGLSLLHKSAEQKHADSLYSLSIIVFNRSEGTTKDPLYQKTGLLYAFKAATLGHVDAIYEVGHCLLEDSGVQKDNAFAIEAIFQTMDEFKTLLSNYPYPPSLLEMNEPHHANRFLIEWYNVRGRELDIGLRICSREGCGRPETRCLEFRRCTNCGNVSYCSRACQNFDWKIIHSEGCMPVEDNNDYDDVLAALVEAAAIDSDTDNDDNDDMYDDIYAALVEAAATETDTDNDGNGEGNDE